MNKNIEYLSKDVTLASIGYLGIDNIRKEAQKRKVEIDDRHLYAILDVVTLELTRKYKTTFVKKVHSDALKHALEVMVEK